MKSQQTTARPPVDLDATDEFPMLDAAAYEAQASSPEPAGPPDSRATGAEPAPPATESSAPNLCAPSAPAAAADSDAMLAVEHWIVQKTEELRAHHEELSLAQRERAAAVARADALSRELAETNARLAQEISALESRLRDSEARERNAQRTIEAQNHAHGELTHRAQHDASARGSLATEVAALQAQLATCVESLQNRESYRTIYDSSLRELDAERAAERDESERRRNALESRLAELTSEHAEAQSRLLAMEATVTAARQRSEAEGLAGRTAAERLRELESAVASRGAELAEAQLEIERNRELLAELTAALLKSQTMFCDQGRLLEQREAAASSMSASHSEQAALVTSLRGRIEELTARLAAPEAERRALEERVAALTKEVGESDSRLVRLESMNSALRATVGQLNTSLAERDAELQRATQIASMNAYALGRVQSSIDELGSALTASEGSSAQAQVSVLTRIDRGQNHSVVLRGRTTIGRDRDNDLPLAMRSVSRHHAVLIPAFRTAFVQDLRSTNGVLVNDHRVRCARLEHGDVVAFGEAEFRYTVTPVPANAVSIGSTHSGSARASLKHSP